jgi:hypothetical protein
MATELSDKHLTWYMDEVAMHSLGAKQAYRELTVLVSRQDVRQTRRVWFALTRFLSHAAMVSKFLKPISSNSIAKDRSTKLCAALDVDDDSPVLNREARDNTEHFDERIDNWVRDDRGDILEIVFPNRAALEKIFYSDARIRRVLILDEFTYLSEDRDGNRFEIELRPLKEEIVRIAVVAEAWITTKSPHQFILSV